MRDDEQLPGMAPEAEQEKPATLHELLRKRHPPGEWAFMEEVAPRTGGGTRYADAIAVHLWSSRGHVIHGFEVKISRGDWLRELKQPEKAEPVYRYCDHWFLVSEKNVVKDGELPITWGHIERSGSGLRIVKPAPKLEAAPVGRAFFASLMRRAHEQVASIAAGMVRDRLDEVRKEREQSIAEGIKRATRRHEDLERKVAEFVKATGLPLDEYRAPPIAIIRLAEKLQALEGWQGMGAFFRLTELAKNLESAAQTVRDAAAATGLVDPEPPAG